MGTHFVAVCGPDYGYDGPGHGALVLGVRDDFESAMAAIVSHAATVEHPTNALTTIQFADGTYTIQQIEED